MLKHFKTTSQLTCEERNQRSELSLKNSFNMWCTPSFRPSDIYKTKRHTVEMEEHPHSNEGTTCSNCNEIRDRTNQTKTLKLNKAVRHCGHLMPRSRASHTKAPAGPLTCLHVCTSKIRLHPSLQSLLSPDALRPSKRGHGGQFFIHFQVIRL